MRGFTHAELAACAEREIKQRRRVYARLVERGQMTPAAAEREILMMQAIAEHFRELVHQDPQASGVLL